MMTRRTKRNVEKVETLEALVEYLQQPGIGEVTFKQIATADPDGSNITKGFLITYTEGKVHGDQKKTARRTKRKS